MRPRSIGYLSIAFAAVNVISLLRISGNILFTSGAMCHTMNMKPAGRLVIRLPAAWSLQSRRQMHQWRWYPCFARSFLHWPFDTGNINYAAKIRPGGTNMLAVACGFPVIRICPAAITRKREFLPRMQPELLTAMSTWKWSIKAMNVNIEFAVKKPQDQSIINPNDLGELLWWSYNLGISPEKLLAIIHDYGSNSKEIEKHVRLNGKGH